MKTINEGLEVTWPDINERNWGEAFEEGFAIPVSAHQHTGNGDGAQLTTNSIADNAITGAKIRLANNVGIRSRNDANSADIEIVKLGPDNKVIFGGPVEFTDVAEFSNVDSFSGNAIGSDLQGYSSILDSLAAISPLANTFAVGNGTIFTGRTLAQTKTILGLDVPTDVTLGGTGASTASQARTNLGLGSLAVANSVNLATAVTGTLSLGNGGTGATTASGARTALELGSVATESTVPVAKGGTGASTASGARDALELGTSATVEFAQMIVPNGGSNNPVTTGYRYGAVVFQSNPGWASRTTSTSSRTHMVFENNNGVVGGITTSGTSTSYNTSSSVFLKKDIEEPEDEMSRIKDIQIAKFRFKNASDDSPKETGVLAEQLEEVYPEMVSEVGGVKMVDYSRLAPLAIKAVQELAAELDILKAEIATLKRGRP